MKGYYVGFDGTKLHIPIRKHLLSILLMLLLFLKKKNEKKKKRKEITAIWDSK